MSASAELDLSTLPADQRDAIAALVREVAALWETTARQEHLIAELPHALYGKTSELSEERAVVRHGSWDNGDLQLAFEDLEVAIAGVEEKKERVAPADDTPRRKKIARRDRGNLPEGLPRISPLG